MGSVRATPDRLNVTVTGGDDLNVLVHGLYSDGSPVNFTGTVTGQVRDHPTSEVVRATLTTSGGTAQGYVTVSLDSVDTRALLAHGPDPLVPTAYYGYWDLQAVEPSTLQIRTVCGGAFNVVPDVTR